MTTKEIRECCVWCRESLNDNYCCLPTCKCHQEEKVLSKDEIKEIMGDSANIDYERNHSHYHCWHQDQPPACGIPLEKHTQCCLCDTPAPQDDVEGWEKDVLALARDPDCHDMLIGVVKSLLSQNQARVVEIVEKAGETYSCGACHQVRRGISNNLSHTLLCTFKTKLLSLLTNLK